jgi:hypothetical protein
MGSYLYYGLWTFVGVALHGCEQRRTTRLGFHGAAKKEALIPLNRLATCWGSTGFAALTVLGGPDHFRSAHPGRGSGAAG